MMRHFRLFILFFLISSGCGGEGEDTRVSDLQQERPVILPTAPAQRDKTQAEPNTDDIETGEVT